MVCAHYPLVNLFRLERGYPKEVGPKEADDLRVGLLDLSSTVIGDINLYGTSTPRAARIRQVGQRVIWGVDCGRWAVDACGLDQPGTGGPDPFGGTRDPRG